MPDSTTQPPKAVPPQSAGSPVDSLDGQIARARAKMWAAEDNAVHDGKWLRVARRWRGKLIRLYDKC
jgi:hypothetical protein